METTARILRLARLPQKWTDWLRGGPEHVRRSMICPVLDPHAPPLSAAQKARRASVTQLHRRRGDH